jgi:hypothetical protein
MNLLEAEVKLKINREKEELVKDGILRELKSGRFCTPDNVKVLTDECNQLFDERLKLKSYIDYTYASTQIDGVMLVEILSKIEASIDKMEFYRFIYKEVSEYYQNIELSDIDVEKIRPMIDIISSFVIKSEKDLARIKLELLEIKLKVNLRENYV